MRNLQIYFTRALNYNPADIYLFKINNETLEKGVKLFKINNNNIIH